MAAGLAVALVLELAPTAAGAFVGEVCIASESSLIRLTLSARCTVPSSDTRAVPAGAALPGPKT